MVGKRLNGGYTKSMDDAFQKLKKASKSSKKAELIERLYQIIDQEHRLIEELLKESRVAYQKGHKQAAQAMLDVADESLANVKKFRGVVTEIATELD